VGSILFGEGVVNDALSILLFKTIYTNFVEKQGEDIGISALFPIIAGEAAWKLVLAAVIGIFCGLVASRIQFKYTSLKSDHIREMCNILLFGYLAYALGECFQCSGILALFFAGTTLAHYNWYNISESSKENSKITFHMISMICEAIAFVYVGISAINMQGTYYLRFSLLMFFILCFARLVVIAGLTLFLNQQRSFQFNWKQVLGLSSAGMVRGSISWAQALKIGMLCPIITSTTLLVVLLSTFVFGVLLPPIIKGLGLSDELDARPQLKNIGAQNNTMLSNESKELTEALLNEHAGMYTSDTFANTTLTATPESRLYRSCITSFRNLDDRLLKHYFGGRKRRGIDSRRNSYHQEPSTRQSKAQSINDSLSFDDMQTVNKQET